MRNVLSNHSEVCHFWANRKQESGNSSNMFFRNDTIYSYGDHFPIARHENLNTILFTTRTYSISTSKHITYTRRAIPADKKIIYVRNVEDINWAWNNPCNSKEGKHFYPVLSEIKNNLEVMENEIISTLKKSITARTNKPYLLSSAQNALDNMADYLELRESALLPDYRKEYNRFQSFIRKTRQGLNDNTISEAIAAQVKAERKAERERQERIRKENAEKIERWKNGENVYLPYLKYAFLRIEKENGLIKTSHNAAVSIREGKILWSMIKAGKSIHGHTIGGYTVISFNGELKIGCHVIERSEVERIGALLDTITE
jgi:hypothetical protein